MLDTVDRLEVVVSLAAVEIKLSRLGAHEGHRVALGVRQGAHTHLEALLALDDRQDSLDALAQQGLVACRLCLYKKA